MNTQRNTETLIVGGTANITDETNYPSSLNASEVGIFNREGTRMTQATAATESHFMVASKDADGVIYTSPIYAKADIKSASALVYSAATAQLDYLGSNGTSGSINVINDNLYMLNIQVQELLRSNTDGRKVKFGLYQSNSSATQSEIALGLTGSLIDNFDREAEKFITFKAICDDAGAIIPTGAGTVAVLNGSKTITFSTAVDNATGATLLVVDEFLRFGTGVTDDVYKIVSIDVPTETLILDRPYQGADDSAVANNAIERITAALGAAGNWGVALTGATLGFVTGKENYEVVRWESQMVDFGTTTDNRGAAAATPGTGVINQMKQLEWFVRGNDGEYAREDFSTTHTYSPSVVSTVTGGGYDMLRLTFDSTHQVGFQNNVSPSVLTIITPATVPQYAANAQDDDITDILEVLAGTGIVAVGGLSLG